MPVEVHNYGFPAWVAWQEHQYMEHLLAQGEDFDVAIFLDGFNEFDVQQTDYSTVPTHHSANIIDGLIADFREERATEPGTWDGLSELAESYRRNSAAWRIADAVRGRTVPVPGTEQAVQGTPEEQTDNALDIYGRSVSMISDLAEDHQVPVHFFWQPRAAGWTPDIIARLPPQVTDLSNVFGGEDLFYDVVHTDEPGARLIAEAMWAQAGPEVTQRAAASTG